MLDRLKQKMTYANVASTVALVLAVGGSSVAVAAAMVPKNSVGSPQIVNGAIKTVDLKNNAVRGAKIKDGAITPGKVKDGAITPGKITSGPIGVVRGYAWMDSPGASATLTNGYVYNEGGGAVTSTRTGVGAYVVEFAGLDIGAGNVQVTGYGPGSTWCKVASWGSDSASVRCYDGAVATDALFSIAMIE